MSQYFKIGKLAASFGLKGELVLQHSLGKTSLKRLETIFVEQGKDNLMPYFVTGVTAKNEQETYLKLEGIDSKEAARKLTPRQVWILEADFKKFAAPASPISMLGFHLVNEDEDLGEIIEVIEQPHQVLCVILIDGKEAMIPIHGESLDKIDQNERKVHVSLPDGLLDIYR
jgi:16S rRNA processing protein RimM